MGMAAKAGRKEGAGSYENDELKEIIHKNLVELAKFYGMSTDYLLCLTREPEPSRHGTYGATFE